MFLHPDLAFIQAKNHQQELIAYADQHRLLTAARRGGRTRGDENGNGFARGRPAGNLAECPPRAAAPAHP